MRIYRAKLLAAAGLVVAGVVLATSGTAFPAVSSSSPPVYVDIGDAGSIVARGVGVTIPVTVECAQPRYLYASWVQVTVAERAGTKVISGSSPVANVPCDGVPHTMSVQVLASTKIFKKGTVAVTARMYAEGFWRGYAVVDLTDTATIPIK